MDQAFPQANAAAGYYGLPLLKAPVWTWEVPVYFFVGGAAGAAAVIAAAAEWAGADPALSRDARWMAAAGSFVSPVLLAADLGRPERFLNMLRVFKPQSAMSIGSWTLAAFSSAATASAFAGAIERRTAGALPMRIVSRASGAVAGALGTVMSTYTGVLIGVTAIPAWNENIRILPVHFGASAVASAVSVLELLGHDDQALNALGLAAAAVETVTGAAIEMRSAPGLTPLKVGPSGWAVRAGGVLSGPVPLALRAIGRRSSSARRVAALSAIAGSILTRFGWIAAGRASAHDSAVAMQLNPDAADAARRFLQAAPDTSGVAANSRPSSS